jgi:hypothetical protein
MLRSKFGTVESRQFVEKCLCIFQVGSAEALGEPAIDLGEHRARLIEATSVAEQPRKTHRRAQFPRFGILIARNLDRALEAALAF